MKNELCGKLKTDFAIFTPNVYLFTNYNKENKISKDTKRYIIKRKRKFNDYKH